MSIRSSGVEKMTITIAVRVGPDGNAYARVLKPGDSELPAGKRGVVTVVAVEVDAPARSVREAG